MNIFKFAWKNLWHKPMSTVLNLVLFAFGVSIISALLLTQDYFSNTLKKNQAGIGMVLGAKGSPLQLILCAIYQVDTPTGNISLKDASRLKKHPLVAKAIPQSLGDSFKGHRIVGTTHEYVDLYKGELEKGKLWGEHTSLEVTIGATAAKKLNLKIGDDFHSSHGMGEGGHDHEEEHFKIVGILKPTGTVIDQLLLTSLESIWDVHKHSSKSKANYGNLSDKKEDTPDKQITTMLIKFRNPMGAITLPRMVNEQTSMQAALPSYETARLLSLVENAITALQYLAIAIIVVSGLSIFISLYNSLKERKYELAYLRSLGTPQSYIFGLLLIEGLLCSLVGFSIGIGLSHLSIFIAAHQVDTLATLNIGGTAFVTGEIYLFIGTLIVGFTASIVPAIQAAKTNISQALSE
ncbi:ABC transporter permease [Flammeovirga kamogawensis]|uniref:ABC transporter permease n=1 Tax=Flammeovirga kamogawensis TaxID=373891 RepID=A0ABX8GRF4_9BACT|nr:FtsX-like permease family protein [Flammeovirga kamogawensis]MBB6462154.1 putative ABC transport system permease protein [Flammeovirga kamogawensis]QWG05888.1 ABC transporter permease [Flammeovirga kamogawensis]TRX67712.1 FtsX-like permease family protein [Flammeovirga kamogawensis]